MSKVKMGLVPMWWIEVMANVREKGVKEGRRPNDWQEIDKTEEN